MATGRLTTEIALATWQYGQTLSEGLAADVLHLEGFEDIKPQAPHGGADDCKDILCTKGGRTYVGAVYFPGQDVSFAKVKKKFSDDLEGPRRHNRNGIVFVTNQRLTIGERDTLDEIALAENIEPLILDRDRLRHLLDRPASCGVRSQYLAIPLSESELLAYFAHSRDTVEKALWQNTAELRKISAKLDHVVDQQGYANRTLRDLASSSGQQTEDAPLRPDVWSGGNLTPETGIAELSANITPELILLVHRLTCQDYPPRLIGRFRKVAVWLGKADSSRGAAALHPAAPGEVPSLLTDLCSNWNAAFSSLRSASNNDKLRAVAKFHHVFLYIHPFLDGNGRTARALLMQQCVDLFPRIDMSLLDQGATYYIALKTADDGDLSLLADLIAPVTLPAETQQPSM